MFVSNDYYTIAAPSIGSGVLRATWKQAVPGAELPAAYEAVMEGARCNGRHRFWLLDVSQPLGSLGELRDWLRGVVGTEAAQALGGAVYVAYLVGPELRPLSGGSGLQELRYQAATSDCYLSIFDNAALALGWLRDQQDLETGDVGDQLGTTHWT